MTAAASGIGPARCGTDARYGPVKPAAKSVDNPLIVSSLDLNPRLQTGRGFSRFLFYELHKRESHGFSPSVSHRLDHEVSLQGAGRRVAGADTNDYPAAVQRTCRPDRLRRFVARTCPYV